VAVAGAKETHVSELTQLLAQARAGDANAASMAFSLLYEDLKRLARAKLRQHQPMTLLDTTALVHEVYLKLAHKDGIPVADRHHFFAYAAQVMRSVIVDLARARQAERRGGDAQHVELSTDVIDNTPAPENEVLRVHEALDTLAQADEALARVVEMRYFGGMSEAEIAAALGSSERTVRRQWQKARLLLSLELAG
jgi:RNA polymerase sigma factor (TIGR02999 family)